MKLKLKPARQGVKLIKGIGGLSSIVYALRTFEVVAKSVLALPELRGLRDCLLERTIEHCVEVGNLAVELFLMYLELTFVRPNVGVDGFGSDRYVRLRQYVDSSSMISTRNC